MIKPDNRPLRKRPGETWRDCLLRRAGEHGIADRAAADFDHTRTWSRETPRHDAMSIARDLDIGSMPMGAFNAFGRFGSKRWRGTRRQRRAARQRNMQAIRHFWKHEGRAMLLQGRVGSIFGTTADTSSAYGGAP